jgi:hypothetical protein
MTPEMPAPTTAIFIPGEGAMGFPPQECEQVLIRSLRVQK